ncbi:ribosomal protein S18 acetylase RimI-like enzyme [Hydrogenophaga palleronii]|jgi:ribosomal protein S18 acetylase RimI-like enzyme|uniref:Ribosomal protein S18 acetylase RimI-like enzyme n=1 Tax=Hydrogenophaga palleronii TaxID=65655 RepID=A0ABU1WI77_9BURK|nr:GNAT family N-acetyltransferase [Hydrogenophaga palleronii]MDR7148977.1 ribosomal protein S18 acetylase RimI-like enzyme [Hydrogenophaga palleronii]
MTIDPAASIELVTHADFELFVEYLNDHLADNGVDDTYFQPLQRGTPRLSEERVSAFRNGLDLAIGTAGWRRLWVMRSTGGQIVGHIDLRSHPERFTEHRCLLGMGVHRQYRRQRIGVALLSFAETWAIEKAGLEWIDLQVLAENRGAIELYCRMGFGKTGEIPEMFKIDGCSFSYVFMAKSLVVREPGSGGAPAPNE